MKARLIILFLALFCAVKADVPPRPEPPRLYNNLSKEFPDFLDAAEAEALENKLQQFSNETSNQICVVIVDDLGGTDASSFAFEIGNTWGVGQKGFNNGIVVLVKPTGGSGGRDLFIATGYGLEGAIPDLMTKRVREDHMYPHLKDGRNYEALDEGTTALMQLAKGEYNQKDKRVGKKQKGLGIGSIITIVIIFLILRSLFGGGGGTTFSGRGRSIFWGGLLGGLGGRGFGGGGRSWGGGGGFGGGSGGWGGFGGGGFGGGGSGGKW